MSTKNGSSDGKPFTTKWNESAYKALVGVLVNVMTRDGETSMGKHKDKLLGEMKDRGYDFTWEAMRQHLQKLRRKEDKNGGGGDASAGPSTPKPAGGGRKKSVALSVKKEPGSGTKRKSVVAISDDEEDVKPSKKAKDEAVKKEEFGDDSDIAYAG